MYRSINTIGADAARNDLGATGEGIVWAVVDAGIDATHEHFQMHRNLDVGPALRHYDFTEASGDDDGKGSPLVDENGHGTYVAGIIAGERGARESPAIAAVYEPSDLGENAYERSVLPPLSGMAPRTKLVSIKALEPDGLGRVSTVIRALRTIQDINVDGRALRIHGVMIGLGFDYDTSRFECGLSPLCVEVDRLVRSGVVVVCAAGSRGFGKQNSMQRGVASGGVEVSIDDPGNAELAITVGSTHRDLPKLYGVSYYSSKGPTLDGRTKPDLVAPGARIVSCAAGSSLTDARQHVADCTYIEQSGTSGAAAHVSGAIAAFLSVRRDLIGRPDVVKETFLSTACDLGRDRNYQGRGLIDVRAALGLQASMPVTPPPIAQRAAPARTPMPTTNQPANPLRLMCSYSHKDATLRKELDVYIAPLKRQGIVESWYDGEIEAGAEWRAEIMRNLEEADIIVLLISADFLASDFCYDIEMMRALERHDAKEARVIPVIVRKSDWSSAPFAKLQALPKDALAVTLWTNQDEAWTDVAMGIRRAAESLQRARASSR
jgi:hypothetical protein